MEFKGTKGPWFLSNNDSSGKTEKPIIRGEGRMVCMLPPISPDNEANAKLIAAAPELLNALQECMAELYTIHSQYGDKQNARDHSVALVKAESAVSKALTTN